MSMPNIPDICPKICINREEAINLLLASIALEEFGLADIIEVESKKIKFVLGEDDKHSTKDILNINNSVNSTIKDIIKLQMLLQFKLENVMELTGTSSCTTTCSSTSTSSTTTTCRTTTACSTTTTCPITTTCSTTKACSTTTFSTTTTCRTTTTCSTTKACCKKSCHTKKIYSLQKEHILCGTGHGDVMNVCDPFFRGIASVQPYVSNKKQSGKYNSINYVVKKGNMLETMNVFPDSIKADVAPDNKFIIIIKGIGSIEKKVDSQPEILGRGSFELKVWVSETGLDCDSFQMIITAQNKSVLNHNSGRVKLLGFGLAVEKR